MITDMIDDFVSRTHLTALEQSAVGNYETILQISRNLLSTVPHDIHDIAVDNLYNTLVQTGILKESEEEQPRIAPVKPKKPSTVRKQRDVFLAESLGITTSRLKYNQETLKLIPVNVLKYWHYLDELYCAAVYNTTQFAKDKRGKYAVFMDGRLQSVYDTHESASKSSKKQTTLFPFETYIVCIGDEWNVPEQEPPSAATMTTANDTKNSSWRQWVCECIRTVNPNKFITWLIENPLVVLSIIVLITIYFIVANQIDTSKKSNDNGNSSEGIVFVHIHEYEWLNEVWQPSTLWQTDKK